MELEIALKIVKAAGYRVSKPREKTVAPARTLNAVGKPYGANYDPNYKIQTRLTPISRLSRPGWKRDPSKPHYGNPWI